MKETQCQRILDLLRRAKAMTNMDLIVNLRIGSPHKRISDMTGPAGEVYERDSHGLWRATGEKITRERIKTAGGAYVTLYRLGK